MIMQIAFQSGNFGLFIKEWLKQKLLYKPEEGELTNSDTTSN